MTERSVSNVMPVRVVPVDKAGRDFDDAEAVPIATEDATAAAVAVDIASVLLEIRDELRTITTILVDAYQLRDSPDSYRAAGRGRAA